VDLRELGEIEFGEGNAEGTSTGDKHDRQIKKGLFYEITGKDPLGTNRFVGTWETVKQARSIVLEDDYTVGMLRANP